MRYVVLARDWNDELKARFGERGSVHELADSEVLQAIISFGRASLPMRSDGDRELYFENDYD